ncbi:putative reverse transcriptase domain-containing protein [Tanacetum coccineum]
MSSPSHPTSNIEDAFSSNFLDYIPASPDYIPASPGKTYSNSSNNSFGLVPIASLTLLLFYNDPYMKVMHPYYAKESPIPPPTIVPPSLMLSLMFNPQEFFLSEELLPLKKQGHNQSFSSTSTLPQEFEIGESSRKTSLERHEEQIEEILNHLDELSLDRIEHIEDKIEGLGNGRVIIQQDFDNLEAELQKARAQIAKHQRKQLGNNNKIALARFRVANLEQIIDEIQVRHQVDKESTEGTVGLIRWFERTKSVFSHSNCTEDCKVKFATGTLIEEALSWWNSFAQPIGIEEAYKITWCRKTTNNNAQGRAYMLRDRNAHQDPNVVTDYDCEIRYHPGKANVVADDLSQKERIKPLRVRSLVMTIHPNLPSQILKAPTEELKEENFKAENLRGMEKSFEIRPDGTRCIKNQSWLPLFGNLRDLIIHESHKSKYSIHLGSDKMYPDLKKLYWWPNMKTIIAEYVGKCLTCSRVKAECQKPSGLLVQPEIPMWKWERIMMDFVTKLPKTSNEHDTIWVIVDRLTKYTHFIPNLETDSMKTLTKLYIKEIVSQYRVPIFIISDCDSHFTSRFWQSLQSALGTQLDMSTENHPETDGQSERTIQTLEDMLRAPI